MLATATTPAAAQPAWRIYIREPGVYRVFFKDLAAGLATGETIGADLKVENRGRPVPLWVEDGGDGTFGPGDWLELVGETLAGESAHFHEYSTANVYRLSLGPGQRMISPPASGQPVAGEGEAGRQLWRRRHLEEDKLLIRLPGSRKAGPAEPWFWAKLAHNRPPWTLDLDLSDLDADAAERVALRVSFRALSHFRSGGAGDIPGHRVEVSLDGSPIAVAEWDGKTEYLLEAAGLEASLFAGGSRRLELHVPERPDPRSSNPIIDVVMLNWIEIDYPRRQLVGQEPVHFHLGPGSAAVQLRSAAGKLVAYGDRGSRIEVSGSLETTPAADGAGGPPGRFRFRPREDEASYHLVAGGRLRSPEWIEVDQPSGLRTAGQSDYLMIAHRRLLEAVRPLADLHRRRGLSVALIDVQDVYDEFNHGILHPGAIRDFIAHAYGRWPRPAPRFVLLVGDASWDTKNATVDDANYANWPDRQLTIGDRFVRKGSTPYELDPQANRRQLIPTWNYATYQGHAASDNYFVAVDGDDFLPDLAIGRLPVATPEVVAEIVAKTVRYASRPEVGPWRRSTVLITNESSSFQVQSDALALRLAAEGLSSLKVYPASTETSNEHHSRRLIETLNGGQLLVHFLGHGGRYIWRTGPPDLDKNHDLFTLEHLEQLEPTSRLPVVVSLTCFSAPFDHPNADSIGEKLLRLADRGAVAILAASWRNTPSARWSVVLLDELTAPGTTVGEAVMRAKHQIRNQMFVETYNLLGDPAVPVALPAGGIELSADDPVASGQPLRVRGVVGLVDFTGRMVVDLVDERGETVRSASFDTAAPEFAVDLGVTAEELATARLLRAYAWNAERGVDAVGTVELAAPAPPSGDRPQRLGRSPGKAFAQE